MDGKWTHVIRLDIVHEEPQQFVVLVQFYSLVGICEGVLESERVAEHMSLETLEKKHLTGAEHATPARITRVT